jgi:hypothetical protein
MSRKKKWLCFGIAAAPVVAVYLVMRPGVPKNHIDFAGYQKINKGMTLAEVESILGVPVGDYTTGPTSSLKEWGDSPAPTIKEWISDKGLISVWIDDEDRIREAYFLPVSPRNLTLLEKLQVWLGLREKTLRVGPLSPDW